MSLTTADIRPSLGPLRSARRGAPILLTAPALGVAALTLLPIVWLLLRSFEGGADAWRVLARVRTLELLARSLGLAVVVATASVAISIPLAWLSVRSDLPGRRVLGVVAALPLAIPSYVGALALIAAFGPRGMLQQVLAPLGVERLPEIYGFGGAALALTLFSYPYAYLPIRSALQGLDPTQEEAARSLGRGPWRVFFGLTLPRLRPAIGAGALMSALYVLSDFGAVALMRCDTFTRAIYLHYQSAFDRSGAAILALALVSVTLLLLLAETLCSGRGRRQTGSIRPAARAATGAWRLPALGFAGLVALLSLGMPVLVLSYWAARGALAGETFRPLWLAAWNSAHASALAAAACAALALPVAWLSLRHPRPFGAAAERIVYVGFGLPGIVIALAFVFFGARFVPAVYQTLGLLVAAYVARFLPQAVAATRASLAQAPPSLEEAARGLGRSPIGALLAVTAPLARPGIVAGAALVFLTTIKELPATLLLSPPGFDTLAGSIWSATNGAFYARAAAPALLLLAVSAPLTIVLMRRGERGEGDEA